MKKRRTNRAKQVSHQCRNNGTCPWCTGNRTYSTKKRSLYDELMLGFQEMKEDREEREMKPIAFEEDIPLHLEFEGFPCIIIDVAWMEQQILNVPVPIQVRILWEQDETLYDAWVSPNLVKSLHKEEVWKD